MLSTQAIQGHYTSPVLSPLQHDLEDSFNLLLDSDALEETLTDIPEEHLTSVYNDQKVPGSSQASDLTVLSQESNIGPSQETDTSQEYETNLPLSEESDSINGTWGSN